QHHENAPLSSIIFCEDAHLRGDHWSNPFLDDTIDGSLQSIFALNERGGYEGLALNAYDQESVVAVVDVVRVRERGDVLRELSAFFGGRVIQLGLEVGFAGLTAQYDTLR